MAQIEDIARSTVFAYIKKFPQGGVEGLLERDHGGGRPGVISPALRPEFIEKLKSGEFIRAKDAQHWIKQKTGKTLSAKTIYYHLGKAAGVLKVPRKTHIKKDEAAVAQFKERADEMMLALSGRAAGQRVRVWVADEHRYGLLPVIRRCWSLRGPRVKAPY